MIFTNLQMHESNFHKDNKHTMTDFILFVTHVYVHIDRIPIWANGHNLVATRTIVEIQLHETALNMYQPHKNKD